MALSLLNIINFRNILSIELEPLAHGFNLICGDNGSGKTSFLEAIHLLSLGKSFRSSQAERMINNDADNLSIFAQILDQDGRKVPAGMERNKDKSAKIRLNGKDQDSITELARLIPIRLINSQSYHLLDGGPVFRRKYLDWGVFYLNNDFLLIWQKFNRALKQRNAALRNRLSAQEVSIWTQELIETSARLDVARQAYVQGLTPLLNEMLKQLLDSALTVTIDYHRGWDNHLNYEAILASSYHKDAFLGYTQFGPHKADLKIHIQQILAKDFLSRGQQKLLVCAMILAQGKLLSQVTNKQPIFLIDDLPSELDSHSLGRVMGLLTQQQTQVFVTAIDQNSLKDFVINSATKVFHVEQGILRDGVPTGLR